MWSPGRCHFRPASSANTVRRCGDRRARATAEESGAAHLLPQEGKMQQIQERQGFQTPTSPSGCRMLSGEGTWKRSPWARAGGPLRRQSGSVDADASQLVSQGLQSCSASRCKGGHPGPLTDRGGVVDAEVHTGLSSSRSPTPPPKLDEAFPSSSAVRREGSLCAPLFLMPTE